jgi:gliding motility-associated lipoprotein GldD
MGSGRKESAVGSRQSAVCNHFEFRILNFEFAGNKFLLLGLSFLLFTSCEDDYSPKPRGFQRIDLPKQEYAIYHADCGFSLDVPTYATMKLDDHPTAEKCWYNISYAPFNATLHLSYKPYKNEDELFKLTEDARTLVYKHTIKADEIYETQINNAYLSGMLYELSGSTATNFQFYALDSTGNFIRGALYFNTKTNTDSVAPVLAFLKEEVLHSIESLRWK